MNTLATVPMMLAMLCAAACALLEKCRTAASIVCAVVMVISMIDAMYTHYIPIAMLAAAIVTTGIWAGADGWRFGESRGLLLRIHRIATACVMASLLFFHVQAMAAQRAVGEICTTSTDIQAMQHHMTRAVDMISFSIVVSVLLFISGLVLSIGLYRSLQESQKGIAVRAASLEPALMGISLVLMAI